MQQGHAARRRRLDPRRPAGRLRFEGPARRAKDPHKPPPGRSGSCRHTGKCRCSWATSVLRDAVSEDGSWITSLGRRAKEILSRPRLEYKGPHGKCCAPLGRSGKLGNSENGERRLRCAQAMSGNDDFWPGAAVHQGETELPHFGRCCRLDRKGRQLLHRLARPEIMIGSGRLGPRMRYSAAAKASNSVAKGVDWYAWERYGASTCRQSSKTLT